MLRPVSAITLLLGLIYTLKVFDIVWIMTRGGPADSSTTLATWSYRLGFGNMLPAFSPGAAVGNLLIVMALMFGLIYTLKVFDIVWIMTRGGPADSSSTLATWSYRLGFGNMLPAFSPGAAVGNLLIVLALIFGLIYIRAQRRQHAA